MTFGPREHVHAVRHLRVGGGAFALLGQRPHARRQAADLLDALGGVRSHVDVRREVEVGHGDDRGHRAPPVADLLEQLEGPLVVPLRGHGVRGDGQRVEHVLQVLAAHDPGQVGDVLARRDLFDEPRPDAPDLDASELAVRGREGGDVPELLGELGGPGERLFRGVEVHLGGRGDEPLAELRAHEGLPQLQGRAELGLGVAPLGGERLDAPGQLRRPVLLAGQPNRGRAPEHHVELEVRVAERVGERGQLGQALQPVERLAEHVLGVVAEREQRDAVLRARGERQRHLDRAQDLLGGVRRQGRARGVDREPRASLGQAGRGGVVGEQREALDGRLAVLGEHVDDGGVDRPAPRRAQRPRARTAGPARGRSCSRPARPAGAGAAGRSRPPGPATRPCGRAPASASGSPSRRLHRLEVLAG